MSPSSCISGCGGKDDVQVPLPSSIPGPTRWAIRLFPVRPLVPVAAAVGRSSNASPRACTCVLDVAVDVHAPTCSCVRARTS
jgi:hypothetical protein